CDDRHGPRGMALRDITRAAALVVLLACGMTLVAVGLLGTWGRPAPLAPPPPPTPADIWGRWSFDPLVLIGLALGAWLYLRGVGRLWRRAGPGRGVRGWQVACWLGGLLAVGIALLSPVEALGEALFAGHMAQHLALILVA